MAALAALLILSASAVAVGQETAPEDLPGVSLRPEASDPGDPGAGDWFILELDETLRASATAVVTNVAEERQTVRLYAVDLDFDSEGQPQANESEQQAMGLWVRVGEPVFEIGPSASRRIPITVTVPADAEPGDHVGWLMAETRGVQGDVEVVKRVAARIYATVPGDAQRSFLIEQIDVVTDSLLWPREASTVVRLRNDGRVRLRPEVLVRGVPADGSVLLMSRSVEQYVATVPLPWYGGIARLPVMARSDGGLVRTATKTQIVVPWGGLIILVLAVLGVWRGRHWWRRRQAQRDELRADIQRLERLVTQHMDVSGKPAESTSASVTDMDEEAILAAAIQRARRTNDHVGLGRAALTVHATTGEALEPLLEAFAVDEGKHREALLTAIAGYEASTVTAHPGFALLSDDDAAVVRKRIEPSADEPKSAAKKAPAKNAAAKRQSTRKPASTAHKRTANKATKKAAPKKPKKDE